MKKSILTTLALATLILLVDVHEVSARGRRGGGMSYGRSSSYRRPATTNYTARTRPVSTYHRPATRPAYRPATRPAYRPVGGAVYRPAGATAVRARRAVGYRTGYLPAGYTTLAVGAGTYYNYGSDYYTYDESDQQYTVVDPPLGATVSQLPQGATLVAGHKGLYVANGVYYRPYYEDGVVVYTVSNP